MKDHRLQLNLAKTELLVVSANPSFHHNFTFQLHSSTITPSKTARNLGVVIEDQLNLGGGGGGGYWHSGYPVVADPWTRASASVAVTDVCRVNHLSITGRESPLYSRATTNEVFLVHMTLYMRHVTCRCGKPVSIAV